MAVPARTWDDFLNYYPIVHPEEFQEFDGINEFSEGAMQKLAEKGDPPISIIKYIEKDFDNVFNSEEVIGRIEKKFRDKMTKQYAIALIKKSLQERIDIFKKTGIIRLVNSQGRIVTQKSNQ